LEVDALLAAAAIPDTINSLGYFNLQNIELNTYTYNGGSITLYCLYFYAYARRCMIDIKVTVTHYGPPDTGSAPTIVSVLSPDNTIPTTKTVVNNVVLDTSIPVAAKTGSSNMDVSNVGTVTVATGSSGSGTLYIVPSTMLLYPRIRGTASISENGNSKHKYWFAIELKVRDYDTNVVIYEQKWDEITHHAYNEISS
jgi:hypothetical protein